MPAPNVAEHKLAMLPKKFCGQLGQWGEVYDCNEKAAIFHFQEQNHNNQRWRLQHTDAAATELWVVPMVVCVYSVYSVSCLVNMGPSFVSIRWSGNVTTGTESVDGSSCCGIVSSEFDSALVVVSKLLLSSALIVACACIGCYSWCRMDLWMYLVDCSKCQEWLLIDRLLAEVVRVSSSRVHH